MSLDLVVDLRDLFPIYVPQKNEAAGTKRSSQFRSSRRHRELVDGATSCAAAALNSMNEQDEFYVAEFEKDSLPSCRCRTQVPKVQ